MTEIGRAGWFTLGATTMAAAGVSHAVAGLGRIAREMTRSRPAGDRREASPGSPDPRAAGAGGWILFSALILAGGTAYQAIAGTRDIVREIVHAASAQ